MEMAESPCGDGMESTSGIPLRNARDSSTSGIPNRNPRESESECQGFGSQRSARDSESESQGSGLSRRTKSQFRQCVPLGQWEMFSHASPME